MAAETLSIDTLTTVAVTVEVLLMPDESGQIVAYCPALEVSSYGDDEADARAAFAEALDISLESSAEKGTLDQWLLALGWRICKKPVPTYDPPRLPLDVLNQPRQRIMPWLVQLPVS